MPPVETWHLARGTYEVVLTRWYDDQLQRHIVWGTSSPALAGLEFEGRVDRDTVAGTNQARRQIFESLKPAAPYRMTACINEVIDVLETWPTTRFARADGWFIVVEHPDELRRRLPERGWTKDQDEAADAYLDASSARLDRLGQLLSTVPRTR